jgi:hypothetical protein
VGQENITILHWNKETFRDESLKSQQLVEVNQAGKSLFPNLSQQFGLKTMHTEVQSLGAISPDRTEY